MAISDRQLGEYLIDMRVLDRDGLQHALAQLQPGGPDLAEMLLATGAVSERYITAARARQDHYEVWDPKARPIAPAMRGLIPRSLAYAHTAVAVDTDQGTLLVAVPHPVQLEAIEQIGADIKWPIRPLVAHPTEITTALVEIYGPPTEAEAPTASTPVDDTLHLHDLLSAMMDKGASDLHLSAGLPPYIRVHGSVRSIPGYDALSASTIQDLIYGVLTQRQREQFEERHELDTSYTAPSTGRFRLNIMLQRESVAAVMRAIPTKIVPLADLGLPSIVSDLCRMHSGLVLVTGATGSGKSTTLASMIDQINSESAGHIITIEDPIEFLHHAKRCVVNQREVGQDTDSFAEALRRVLRQDPDVILVGEMRDLETISMAITAAETGHLVFGTLHTKDASSSVDRMVDVFPAAQQAQIRTQLSGSLRAVITQQLIPRPPDRGGRALAVEIMVITPAIANLIREGKVPQIRNAMTTGAAVGMVTMDQSLAQLVRSGQISQDVGASLATNPDGFTSLVAGAHR